jgi:hypothetical protein
MDFSQLTEEQQGLIEQTILMITEARSLSHEEKTSYILAFSQALADGKGLEFIQDIESDLREKELPWLQKEKEQLLQENERDLQAIQNNLQDLEKIPEQTQNMASQILDEAYKQAEESKNKQNAAHIDAIRKLLQK